MLKDLFSKVGELNIPETKSRFVFTPEYKVDLALVACSSACDVFKKTTKKAKDDSDPKIRLNKLKSTFLTKFKDHYRKVSAEKSAANILCQRLRDAIEDAFKIELQNTFVEDVMRMYHLQTKQMFKITILENLAEEDSFSMYKTYLTDMSGCFHYWIRHYLDRYYKEQIGTKNRACKHVEDTLSCKIQDSIDAVEDLKNIDKIETWLNEFNKKLMRSKIVFDASEVKNMISECNVLEFSKYVKTGIINLERDLKDAYSSVSRIEYEMSWRNNSPENLLYSRLIGCTETCPFCHEQCEMTTQGHSGPHIIKLHRYQCLGYYVNSNTNELFLYTCSQLVGSETEFKNSDTNWKLHPYKCYQSVNERYGKWNIDEHDEDPLYWQWFIVEYYKDIKSWVSASDTKIPPEWYKVAKTRATYSLKHIISESQ